MKTKKIDILIIGAGLTGLTLAYYLKSLSLSVKIIEARPHVGGRIKTKYNLNQAPIELGATWLIDQQVSALELLKELNVPVFEQHYGRTAIYHPDQRQAPQLVQLPTNSSKSYRVTDGTFSIIKALTEKLSENTIECDQKVNTIKLESNILEVNTNDYKYECNYVISTLPPLLFSKKITIEPHLPKDIQEILSKTHTWMRDSIRIGFTYKEAFWEADNSSGTIYSSAGPIQEFYDHSSNRTDLYALSGFMNTSFSDNTKEERKMFALKQLQSYYGDQALGFESYEECVWKGEYYTSLINDHYLMPQTNNGNPAYRKSYLNNRLFIAGAETSPVFPGKMEGAIASARYVYEQLKAKYSTQ